MALTVIKYFGTSTTEAGHYIWDVYEKYISNRSLNFKHLPFNPEDLVKTGTPFGDVSYQYIENYTIIAISGSPKDKRHGTKSVFWVDRKVKFEVLKNWITNIESTKRIIDTMPFEIKW